MFIGVLLSTIKLTVDENLCFVQIAWALNKGIKSAHKKFWDVERGVCYIPWSKVKVEELESYREGGMLDADTLNPGKLSFVILTYLQHYCVIVEDMFFLIWAVMFP